MSCMAPQAPMMMVMMMMSSGLAESQLSMLTVVQLGAHAVLK